MAPYKKWHAIRGGRAGFSGVVESPCVLEGLTAGVAGCSSKDFESLEEAEAYANAPNAAAAHAVAAAAYNRPPGRVASFVDGAAGWRGWGSVRHRRGSSLVGALSLMVVMCWFGVMSSSSELSTAPTTQAVMVELARRVPERQGEAARRPRRDVLLYLLSEDTPYQRGRVAELSVMYGEDLFVVWGPGPEGAPFPGPAEYGKRLNLIDDIALSETRRWDSSGCCAGEKATMWLIAHQREFDFAWIMHDDVYYSDLGQLDQVLSVQSSEDLLNNYPAQNRQTAVVTGSKAYESAAFVPWAELTRRFRVWFSPKRVKPAAIGAVKNMFWKSEYNLYRLSAPMAAALQRWYELNDERWTDHEGLLPTLAMNDPSLRVGSLWRPDPQDDPNGAAALWSPMLGRFKHRPCWTREAMRRSGAGVYHPVRIGLDGAFVECAKGSAGSDAGGGGGRLGGRGVRRADASRDAQLEKDLEALRESLNLE